MTMRTRDRIVCDCGHQGSLCCAENDQPYSSLWESYSLEGGRTACLRPCNRRAPSAAKPARCATRPAPEKASARSANRRALNPKPRNTDAPAVRLGASGELVEPAFLACSPSDEAGKDRLSVLHSVRRPST